MKLTVSHLFQLLILGAWMGVVHSDVVTAATELHISNPNSCDAIIADSEIEGTCCSLNNTEGAGCVLHVVGGYCDIKGGIWSLRYTSTKDDDCPPGEEQYKYLTTTDSPTKAPTDGSSTRWELGMLSAIAAAAVSLLL